MDIIERPSAMRSTSQRRARGSGVGGLVAPADAVAALNRNKSSSDLFIGLCMELFCDGAIVTRLGFGNKANSGGYYVIDGSA